MSVWNFKPAKRIFIVSLNLNLIPSIEQPASNDGFLKAPTT